MCVVSQINNKILIPIGLQLSKKETFYEYSKVVSLLLNETKKATPLIIP